jgi:apolipoprotein N-acyltransferase
LWEEISLLRERFRSRGLYPGDRPRTLTIAGTRVGVLNCYEDVLPHHARTVALGGPEVLVNITNDAWFGDSSEPMLHHWVSRLRAVETRRDLVRVVNTGVSGHIASTGEELARTETWTRRSFIADAKTSTEITPWMRHGDLLSPALGGALLGAALAFARRRH